MQIKLIFRKGAIQNPPGDFRGAGHIVQEGSAAIYPDMKKPDCDIYPLDLIEKIEVRGEAGEEKVIPFPDVKPN